MTNIDSDTTITENQNRLAEKQKKLQRIKFIATGLLIAMTIIFAVARFYKPQYPWLGYIAAFAEAAMIGALADWFAVVALFRHPLGLPIPHTDLIASNQKSIGQNLGHFVTSNFLSDETIDSRMANFSLSKNLIEWVSNDTNRQRLANELLRITPSLLNAFDEVQINDYLQGKIKKLINQADFSTITAELLEDLTTNTEHKHVLINTITKTLKNYLNDPENQDKITEIFQKYAPKYIPKFVDAMIAEQFINSVTALLTNVEKDKGHDLRLEFDEAIDNLVINLRKSDELREKMEVFKQRIIDSDAFTDYTDDIWSALKKQFNENLTSRAAEFEIKLSGWLLDYSHDLYENTLLQNRIDDWVREEIHHLLRTNRNWIAQHISLTVKNWDKREVADKLEMEVGKDLQFIRINGTLVGGLVGLLIYIIFELIH
ncbi:MAG: DUF445 domain-containing protein [Sphingobacteriales bacterium]|jgi:uncharacterized membrane-anchored protein YjiN (DUF445 family)|nr:DUF445 domain-containing protein [Sphingobacteriales bacterium]MBP9142469.1 DUF445 domain-containing protein [Chitinophagales bacterium]MDA0198080.1 DUF445 domain-containing protein [Bacteroidota bacterium]MBK6891125.1 DUF445 domain-containing protein [Sphingobacteriales bacterium]MBK7527048.1 DUF445 domain-containing protein [Sphingobacteriales bacterium]